jgi:RNA-directed DNA polymerase
MVAKLHAIKAELIRRKHEPTALVGKWLRQVTLGYYQYHAVSGNLDRLTVFMHRPRRMWRAVLARRSQRGRVSWQRHRHIQGKSRMR